MKQIALKIQEKMSPVEVTTKITNKQLLADFCCETNEAEKYLNSLHNLILHSDYEYKVVELKLMETFSDGTSFCTIQIDSK